MDPAAAATAAAAAVPLFVLPIRRQVGSNPGLSENPVGQSPSQLFFGFNEIDDLLRKSFQVETVSSRKRNFGKKYLPKKYLPKKKIRLESYNRALIMDHAKHWARGDNSSSTWLGLNRQGFKS